MPRLVLAILFILIAVALAALMIGAAAKAVHRVGTSPEIATGGSMQKAAFFLLLCLIMYVSVTGGT